MAPTFSVTRMSRFTTLGIFCAVVIFIVIWHNSDGQWDFEKLRQHLPGRPAVPASSTVQTLPSDPTDSPFETISDDHKPTPDPFSDKIVFDDVNASSSALSNHVTPTIHATPTTYAMPTVHTTPLPTFSGNASHDLDPYDRHCSEHPDPGNIAIVLKTGATEAMARVPVQMRTALRCAQSVLIISDLEQDIAGYHIHDALAEVPDEIVDSNSDFDLYKMLKEAHTHGDIDETLSNAFHEAAWTLDKYKQVHALEMLYAAYPGKDWYLMIDADTYLVWPTVLVWLQQIPEPQSNRWYFGSEAVINDVGFAHGGSGIFLSHASMYELAVVHAGAAARWDGPMRDECCGDYVISVILKEMNIDIHNVWPVVNGEKPTTLPYGPEFWCQPLATLHHVTVEELSPIALWDASRDATATPATHADMYTAFIHGNITSRREHWTNRADDQTLTADSFEACETHCTEIVECLQFLFAGNECKLGNSFRFGEADDGDGDEKPAPTSGWLKDRIEQWVAAQPPCGEPEFPLTGADAVP